MANEDSPDLEAAADRRQDIIITPASAEEDQSNNAGVATTSNNKAGGVHPLQSFHDEKVRPLLEQAGTSLRKVTDTTLQKSRELGDSLRKATDTTLQTTLQKSRQLGDSVRAATDSTLQKSRQIGTATVVKSRQIGTATMQGTRSLGLGTQLAAAAAVAKTQQTIASIGADPVETTPDGKVVVKGQESDAIVTSVWSHAIQVVAAAGGLVALVTMVLLEGQLIDIASLATVILSPLVFWQKMKLNALGGMRTQQNILRASCNRLTVENNHLADSNNRLEGEVGK